MAHIGSYCKGLFKTSEDMTFRRASMKVHSLGLLALVVAASILSFVAIVALNLDKRSNTAAITSVAIPAEKYVLHERSEEREVGASITVSDAQKIPLYPNASNISEESFDADVPWRHIVYFQAPATPQEVIDFYKVQLPKAGWHFSYANLYDRPSNRYIGFRWSDPAGAAPFDLTLSVDVDPLSPDIAIVSTWLDRQPDATRVPLYVDARQLTIENEWLQQNGGQTQRL